MGKPIQEEKTKKNDFHRVGHGSGCLTSQTLLLKNCIMSKQVNAVMRPHLPLLFENKRLVIS